ncbi:hypothetical protein [Sporomusa sp. KB1]|jgi:hypothetical protein|uniref:hypothetical protein n=1 Tax=Sporomusa sp. KB1 TaxID=943346 RepID=UPI0011A01608|nr:hypothetical protein [Sporomusa sp. KB1]TWH49271.1 hypothetical protein Salpa_5481 [Sporomusa sp. KB1]
MIIESADNKTHLLKLDDGQPVFNERGGLLTKCKLWVEMKKIYNTGDIEINCPKCSKSLGKI